MKSMIMPTTPEDLIVFLEQHNLEGTITEFETVASSITLFGLPTEINIKLNMVCHEKDVVSEELIK